MTRTRLHYWNCSKLADFIRGTKKPYALELGGWDDWHKKAKNKQPIRYWIAENLLIKLQNLFYFPCDKFYEIKYYFKNRFISKTHYLKTGLKPGKYHELDERIIYGLFTELEEFVECEIAHMHKFYSKNKYVFKKGRCPKSGIDYLKWSSRLKEKNKPTTEAISAKKILKLYYWWKKRSLRPDPTDASGWSEYCEREDSDTFREVKNNEESRKILQKLRMIENRYDKEDENMLIELIKIRKHLWT